MANGWYGFYLDLPPSVNFAQALRRLAADHARQADLGASKSASRLEVRLRLEIDPEVVSLFSADNLDVNRFVACEPVHVSPRLDPNFNRVMSLDIESHEVDVRNALVALS